MGGAMHLRTPAYAHGRRGCMGHDVCSPSAGSDCTSSSCPYALPQPLRPTHPHPKLCRAVAAPERNLFARTHFFQSQELGWSEVESFVSPPAPGTGSTVRLLAIADLGQAEEDGSMEASEVSLLLPVTANDFATVCKDHIE